MMVRPCWLGSRPRLHRLWRAIIRWARSREVLVVTGHVPLRLTLRFSAVAVGAVPIGRTPHRRPELSPAGSNQQAARAPLMRFTSPSALAGHAALTGGAIRLVDPASVFVTLAVFRLRISVGLLAGPAGFPRWPST